MEIIRRCSPALAEHRLAGPGWAESLGGTTTDEALPGGRGATVEQADAKGRPVMARARRPAYDRHKPALVEVLSDPGNVVWELIDRSKARETLDRFQSLSGPSRIELYGAVTAALWLGDSGSMAGVGRS